MVEFRDGRVSPLQKSPIVGTDGIYAVAKNPEPYEDEASRVYAYGFSPEGNERWRRTVYEAEQSDDGAFHRLIATLVSGCLGPNHLYALWQAGDPAAVHAAAVSREDGSVVWSKTFSDLSTPLRPVVEDRTLYFNTGSSVVSLSGTDGSEQWRVDVGAVNQRYPTVGNGAVAVYHVPNGDADPRLSVFEAADGSERWSVPIPHAHEPIPTIDGDTVYVADGGSRGIPRRIGVQEVYRHVHALSLADGSERWTHPYGSEVAEAVAAGGTAYVTVAGDLVYYALGFATVQEYFGSEEPNEDEFERVKEELYRGPNVFALDADSGDVVWETTVGELARVFQPPVVDSEYLYVRYEPVDSDDGGPEIRVLERDSGNVVGSFGPLPGDQNPQVTDDSNSGFGVADGRIYVRRNRSVTVWE